MTEYQRLHLARLSDVFGVDVSEAYRLAGEALEAWIFKAEDDLFDRLHAELRSQKTDVLR
jgi:hypothetical protein